MASGREFSSHQRKIINRYYDNLDTIVITRLGEIVTDMALAAGDQKKLARLWNRAGQALERAKVESKEIERVLETKDIEALAKIVQQASR
ncbi:MAG: hypothetical protein CMJ35_09395 [Phycisphaerae bacterium]|nr:hypothetical protein [Phycisphaerae bacterium]MBM91809.1 hypothetical protein [Phycisphaerae bacterium]HCT46418.1 hypothetical protein [Phycisphaerales bacterium]|tara:strand:- start:858 stop:1127 length:270 start_codon:yes stop_codon:yes gene_type:complete